MNATATALSMAAARTDRPVVAVVDDEQAIRDSLAILLAASGWTVVAFPDAGAFLAARAETSPAVLVLDVKLGSGVDGVTLLERLRALGDQTPAIMATGQADMPTVLRALRAGASDVLEKPYPIAALTDALDHALRLPGPVACARRLADMLSPRERHVLDGLAEGRTNAVLAAELGIPPRQVEADRAAILEKLGVTSLVQALRIAIAARACCADPATCPVRQGHP